MFRAPRFSAGPIAEGGDVAVLAPADGQVDGQGSLLMPREGFGGPTMGGQRPADPGEDNGHDGVVPFVACLVDEQGALVQGEGMVTPAHPPQVGVGLGEESGEDVWILGGRARSQTGGGWAPGQEAAGRCTDVGPSPRPVGRGRVQPVRDDPPWRWGGSGHEWRHCGATSCAVG